MRIPGIIPNTAAETLWWQHCEIIRECEERRRGWEARYGSRHGCPYGCNGSGWRPVEDDEDQEPRFLEVIYDGKLWTPCQCNMRGTQAVWKPFAIK